MLGGASDGRGGSLIGSSPLRQTTTSELWPDAESTRPLRSFAYLAGTHIQIRLLSSQASHSQVRCRTRRPAERHYGAASRSCSWSPRSFASLAERSENYCHETMRTSDISMQQSCQLHSSAVEGCEEIFLVDRLWCRFYACEMQRVVTGLLL